MGAGNVKAIYAAWGHLPDPAFRLLVYMGLVCKDEDAPKPLFWGGRESMALGIGRKPPHDDSDHRAVSRALAKLRSSGAIELDRHSAPGQTARYVIHLTGTGDATRPLNTGRAASTEQETPGDQNTGRAATEQVTPRDRTQDVPRRPEEEQERSGLTSGPITPSKPRSHSGPRSARGRCPVPGHQGAAGYDADGDPHCGQCAERPAQKAAV